MQPARVPRYADTTRFNRYAAVLTRGRGSLLARLHELRRRLIWSALFMTAGFLIAFAFAPQLFEFVMQPMRAMLAPGSSLIYTDPGEAFFLQLELAAIAGGILALPALMTQVWLLVAPSLQPRERRLAIPFIVLSSACFIAGAAFSHAVVFPMTWRFFAGFATEYVRFAPRIEPAFSLYLRLFLVSGLVFQTPVVVLFLARVGLVTASLMMRHAKHAVLVTFMAAAVLTPGGDPVAQVVLAGPMIVLYLLSAGLAWVVGSRSTPKTG